MNRMKEILKGQMIFMAGALLCLFWAAPAFAGNVSASITDTGGNVGIGTSNPVNSKLEIMGINAGIRLIDTGTNGRTWWLESGRTFAGDLVLTDVTSGQQVFGVTPASSGSPFYIVNRNVGIGTTSPHGNLEVSSTAPQLHINDSNGTAGSDSVGYIAFTHGVSGITHGSIQQENGLMTFDSNGGGFSFWNGNVGIGTPAPAGKLHVVGGNSGGPGSGNQVARFEDTVGSGLNVDIGGVNNNYGWIRAFTGGIGEKNLSLQPLGGNVGIGTTDPNRILNVYHASVPRISINSPASAEPGYELYSAGTLSSMVYRPANTNDMRLYVGGGDRISITPTGNVGIGTTHPGIYKLAVKGKIHAEEVVVDTGWADFVFKKDYDLMPLEKVAEHIEETGHLPGIPGEQEVKENGVSIGQIQSKLLQKIEEMTLYVIDLKKENDTLKERISLIENQAR